MNFKEKSNFLRHNSIFYITGFLLIFCMKYYYSRAGVPELKWILAPTAGWVNLLSGIPFEYIREAGYVNHDLKMIIAPSCSGMQFMIITAAMLIFSFVHLSGNLFTRQSAPQSVDTTPLGAARKNCSPEHGLPNTERQSCSSEHGHPDTERNGHSPEHSHPGTASSSGQHSTLSVSLNGFAWIGISLVLSFLFTVFVNGLRIITAVYLPSFFEEWQLYGGFLTPDSLHTAIGTVIYFTALLTLYRLVGHLFHREPQISLLRRCLPPVFWYFFIVLGIPFLNRAYRRGGEQFTGFAILVTACCGGILLLYCTGTLLRKLHSSHRNAG